jgi:lipopolysaccharide-induced tumor necrosis factor-alpha factor
MGYPIGQGVYTQPVIGQAVIIDPNMQNYRSDANDSPVPVIVKCPFCGFIGPTIVDMQPGGATWGWCIIMAIFTGCCCIPFCIDGCQDKYHYCERCGAQVGVKIATMC